MTSILRQIVAGPRAKHPEANLDLCYVTDNIIATSGPGATYPQVAYRNPLKDLVKFLDLKHGAQWAIWEFRAEGTGYPDDEVYGRVWHYPWPDHHPPPFKLIPLIMGSMRNWLKEKDVEGRVVVVHCKAGKGRSGTISCAYLISEEEWTPESAMKRFTERRMKPGFGVGISIPSQQRWIRYVDRWARHRKVYVERPVEILEVHVWGLRDGVKIVVEGFVEEGKTVKSFYTFQTQDREIVRGKLRNDVGFADAAMEALGRKRTVEENRNATATEDGKSEGMTANEQNLMSTESDGSAPADSDVVFRPSSRIVLPSSDVNVYFERRNKTKYGGFTMVTSVAHVWFNAFFEGQGPENDGTPEDSGVFEMEWDAMDGIKGSSRKGTRAFDKFAVVWKAVDPSRKSSVVITEPGEGEEVKQTEPSDWRGEESATDVLQRKLGLRPQAFESESVSLASSTRSIKNGGDINDSVEELEGVKSDVANSNDDQSMDEQRFTAPDKPLYMQYAGTAHRELDHGPDNKESPPQIQLNGVPGVVAGMERVSFSDLPDSKAQSDLKDHQ